MDELAAKRRRRLRRSDCARPGLTRERRGRGFSYLDERRRRIDEPDVLERIRSLAIPPAWRDVWICPDPLGHLQATGIDAAGRKQYLYHPRWRERRDNEKFERMVRFAHRLPQLRRSLVADLASGRGPTRTRVLACAVRMLDVGLFRIGGEEYAARGGGLGLTTIHRDHVTMRNGAVLFDYPAKGGIRRVHEIGDPAVIDVVRQLRRRRAGEDPQLLVHRTSRGWARLRSDDVNDYLKELLGDEFSAKDFRTWNATALAAAVLAAGDGPARSGRARTRAINAAADAVADVLGNTPAVARRSYIDPRVIDRYLSGWTIAPQRDCGIPDLTDERRRLELEHAVLDLLAGDAASPAVTRRRAA